jgi:putative membrane protein
LASVHESAGDSLTFNVAIATRLGRAGIKQKGMPMRFTDLVRHTLAKRLVSITEFNMRTIPALAVLALLTGTMSALAQAPAANDAEFVAKATAGNAFEVEEAKLAVQRATDPRLKSFAQRMITDHADALKKLNDAAGNVNVAPTTTLDTPHQAMLDNLRTFNGADFDKIYKADQVASHAETVALLSDYDQTGKNSALKSWAKHSLPVVKDHRNDINAM